MASYSTPRKPRHLTQHWLLGCVFVLLGHSYSLALEVGELSLLSSLGRPLSAQLQLDHYQSLNNQQLLVSQAPPEVYQQMGVERTTLLRELIITVEPAGVVSIRSRKAINEPYLHFILKFQWPEGELYREYRVLIDPA
jgi:Tfp pilus assembly protein FimV